MTGQTGANGLHCSPTHVSCWSETMLKDPKALFRTNMRGRPMVSVGTRFVSANTRTNWLFGFGRVSPLGEIAGNRPPTIPNRPGKMVEHLGEMGQNAQRKWLEMVRNGRGWTHITHPPPPTPPYILCRCPEAPENCALPLDHFPGLSAARRPKTLSRPPKRSPDLDVGASENGFWMFFLTPPDPPRTPRGVHFVGLYSPRVNLGPAECVKRLNNDKILRSGCLVSKIV